MGGGAEGGGPSEADLIDPPRHIGRASTVDEVGDNAYFADADGCDDGEKLHIRWYLPEPSPAPVPPPACEDSASWFYKKPKNTCAKFVTKKAKNCKKKDSSKIKAMEACPETCGVCDL